MRALCRTAGIRGLTLLLCGIAALQARALAASLPPADSLDARLPADVSARLRRRARRVRELAAASSGRPAGARLGGRGHSLLGVESPRDPRGPVLRRGRQLPRPEGPASGSGRPGPVRRRPAAVRDARAGQDRDGASEHGRPLRADARFRAPGGLPVAHREPKPRGPRADAAGHGMGAEAPGGRSRLWGRLPRDGTVEVPDREQLGARAVDPEPRRLFGGQAPGNPGARVDGAERSLPRSVRPPAPGRRLPARARRPARAAYARAVARRISRRIRCTPARSRASTRAGTDACPTP